MANGELQKGQKGGHIRRPSPPTADNFAQEIVETIRGKSIAHASALDMESYHAGR
jgi:hypothetical protein